MSLIELMMVDCVFMDKQRVPDGQGGHTTSWIEGAPIKCAIVNDTSMQSKIAQAQGVVSTFTITTKKEDVLEYHDVIKRIADGAIFRVTSEGVDKISPSASSLNMAQVSAEKWSLTQ